MVSNVIYQGNFRTEAVHLNSGNTIITDAPVDNEGKGEAFSPTYLVATALASCMLTIMGIIARRDGININGAAAEVEKIMSPNPRRIGKVNIKILFKNQLKNTEKEKLERAAKTCPVSGSLHSNLKETIEFMYP